MLSRIHSLSFEMLRLRGFIMELSWQWIYVYIYIYIYIETCNISILDLIHDFNGLDKDNCETRQETFKIWDLERLILYSWQYIYIHISLLPMPLYISVVCNHKLSSMLTTYAILIPKSTLHCLTKQTSSTLSDSEKLEMCFSICHLHRIYDRILFLLQLIKRHCPNVVTE